MNKILDFLRAFFGLTDDIERIVKPINKIAKKLETASTREARRAATERAQVERLRNRAAGRQDNADKAAALAKTYSTLAGN